MSNGEFITKEVGKSMVDAFQNNNPSHIKAVLYDKGKIDDILSQIGCDGIRIYYGEENGSPCLVLVGVDANGDDMTDALILERGSTCPNNCPTNSYFNS